MSVNPTSGDGRRAPLVRFGVTARKRFGTLPPPPSLFASLGRGREVAHTQWTQAEPFCFPLR